MKRLLFIAVAILLPFAALVVLGFWMLLEPGPVVAPAETATPSAEAAMDPPPSAPAPKSPVGAPSSLGPKAALRLPPLVPPLAAEVLEELRRKPWLFTVDHMVRQCFADVADRYREPQKVTVMFTCNAAGTFDSVVIKQSSWQDPMLDACILDSFEEARFDPGEGGTRRQSHTFTFSPADAGR